MTTASQSLIWSRRSVISIALLAGVFAASVTARTSVVGGSQTILVDDDGPANFASIQAAIDSATNGDTIEVRPGVYSSIDFRGKSLSVVSTDGALSTTIDGQGTPGASAVRRMDAGGDALLQGFTIRGGTGTLIDVYSGGSWPFGGGVLVSRSELDVRHCIIEENDGGYSGGGVGCHFGTVRISDTLIRDNVAALGGAINGWAADVRCERTLILDNASWELGAGAIDMWSKTVGLVDRLELIDVVIDGNRALAAGAMWDGIYNGGEMLVDTVSTDAILNAGWIAFGQDRGPSSLVVQGDFSMVHGSKWFGAGQGRVKLNIHPTAAGPMGDVVHILGTLGVAHPYDQSGSIGILDVTVLEGVSLSPSDEPLMLAQFGELASGFTMYTVRGMPSGTIMDFSVKPAGASGAQGLFARTRQISAASSGVVESRSVPGGATTMAIVDLEKDGYPDVCVGSPSSLKGWAGQVVLIGNAGVDADGRWIGLGGNSLTIGVPGVPRAIAGGNFGGDPYADIVVAVDSADAVVLASDWLPGGIPQFARIPIDFIDGGLSSVAEGALIGLQPSASGCGRIAFQDDVDGRAAVALLPPISTDLACVCEGRFGAGARVRSAVANAGGTGLPAGSEGIIVYAFSEAWLPDGPGVWVKWDEWNGGQDATGVCDIWPCCGAVADAVGQQLSLVDCDELELPAVQVVGQLEPVCTAGGFDAFGNGAMLAAGCADHGTLSARLSKPNDDSRSETMIEYLHPQSDVLIADLNGDGRGDVVAALPGVNAVAISIQLPSSELLFAPWLPLPTGGSPEKVGIGDFDGDGDLDLAVLVTLTDGSGRIEFYRSQPAPRDSDLTFDLASTLELGAGSPKNLLVTDLTGDGAAELLLLAAPSGTSSLTAEETELLVIGMGSGSSCSSDLNGDGVVDGGDLAVILGGWGIVGPSSADLNGDLLVDGNDLALMLGSWGACGQ
jgi:hypothetical protein